MRISFLLPITLLAIAGCDSATGPSFKDLSVTTTVAEKFGLNSGYVIVTTVTNETDESIVIAGNSCPRSFRVETVSGTRVSLAGETCSLALIQVTLRSGQSYDYRNQWDGRDASGAQLSGPHRVIGAPFFDQGPQSEPVTVELPR